MRLIPAKILFGTLLLGMMLPAVLAAAAGSPTTGGDTPQVARVNGNPIYRTDLENEVSQTLSRSQKFGRTFSPEEEKELRRGILDRLIQKELLVQAIAKVDVPTLATKIEQIYSEEQNAFGGPEHFEANLKVRGTNPDDYRQTLGRKIREQAYLEQVGLSPVKVPEELIANFYKQNENSWQHPEVVKVVQFGLAPKDPQAEGALGKTLAAARKLREQWLAGQDLLTLVAELSAQGWKTSGGDLGFIQKGNLPPALEEVAFNLEPGTTSEVVQGPEGLHVLQVVEKRPPGIYALEEVRPVIHRYLENEVQRQSLAKHAEELRAKAQVEVLTQ